MQAGEDAAASGFNADDRQYKHAGQLLTRYVQHLLQQIPRKYSPELRLLLDYIAANEIKAIIELRRQLVS